MHCFRTGVEKGIKLFTAVQEGCGYKDTLRASLLCSVGKIFHCVHYLSAALRRTLCNNFAQVPLQHHFHTQNRISQTVLSELKVTPVLKNWYICKYISYHKFTFHFLMEERESDSRLIIFYHWKASYAYIKLRHVKSPVHLPMMTFEFYVDLIFRQHCDTTIDPASNRSKIKGCLLGIKQEFAQDWQPYQLHLPTV